MDRHSNLLEIVPSQQAWQPELNLGSIFNFSITVVTSAEEELVRDFSYKHVLALPHGDH